MSDVSQGEGWWQAANGKWYAPPPGGGSHPQSSDESVDPNSDSTVGIGPSPLTCSNGHVVGDQDRFCPKCGDALFVAQGLSKTVTSKAEPATLPWVNFTAGFGPKGFTGGGHVIGDGVENARSVRLTFANDIVIEDTIDNGVVLFFEPHRVVAPAEVAVIGGDGGALVTYMEFVDLA